MKNDSDGRGFQQQPKKTEIPSSRREKETILKQYYRSETKIGISKSGAIMSDETKRQYQGQVGNYKIQKPKHKNIHKQTQYKTSHGEEMKNYMLRKLSI